MDFAAVPLNGFTLSFLPGRNAKGIWHTAALHDLLIAVNMTSSLRFAFEAQ